MRPAIVCAQLRGEVLSGQARVVLPPYPCALWPNASVSAPRDFARFVVEPGALRGLELWSEFDLNDLGGTLLVPAQASRWLTLGNTDGERALADAWRRFKEHPPAQWRAASWHYAIGPADRPLIMGIVNVTPDSFSDGGRFASTSSAVAHGESLVGQGADILDVGGESTRPGSDAVGCAEEIARVVPVIEALCDRVEVPISVDTRKAAVARAAIAAGASIVNDVSALRDDPEMVRVVSDHEVGLILMHMRGAPKTMQWDTHYTNLYEEIVEHLERSLWLAYDGGVDMRRVLLDPGIGFGKRLEQNLELIGHLECLWALGRPQLLGPSRKRFLGELTGRAVEHRSAATTAVVAASVLAGAGVLRVHEVDASLDAVRVAHALRPSFAGRP